MMREQIKRAQHINIMLFIMLFIISAFLISLESYYLKKLSEPAPSSSNESTEIVLKIEEWTHSIKFYKYEMPWLDEYYEMKNILYSTDLSFEYIETKYLGRYFITAYCPKECGYNGYNYPIGWKTSTDTICHYSDTWYEPTTCAIDPSVRRYGEYIMVGSPDSDNKKIYRCEDCGPGVRGNWVDCFVETMDEVRAWDTRYDSVYLVTFKTQTVRGNELYELDRRMDDALNEILMPKEIEYYKFGE